MNIYTNGKGIGSAPRKFEAAHSAELAPDGLSRAPEAARDPNPEWEDEKEFFFQQTLPSISQTARRVAPLARHLASIAVRALVGAVPEVRAIANPLTAQLLYPLIQRGEQKTRQREAEFFSIRGAEVEVANTGLAHEAALTEVLAAEASQAQSESEAAALIGTALPLSIGVMGGQRSLGPVLPLLLVATARLVRFLHRHSPASRLLLRLVPTIFRRTVASLQAAQQWGCPMTLALVNCIMAVQTKRVLGNAPLVTQSIIRNATIRSSTVAVATRIHRADSRREPFPSALTNGGRSKPVLFGDRQFKQFTRRNRIMALFEAPISQEANYQNNPYANPEMEDLWATPEVNPYSNPEGEWEDQEMANYANPEYEGEWEYPEMANYANPEYEGEWEYPEMANYANPEYEGEWEYPEMANYANPEYEGQWEDQEMPNAQYEGDAEFWRKIKKFAKKAWKVAAPLAKKLAPKLAGTLVGMIPGVGAVASPLAAKLTGSLVKEGEMEAVQMEAEFFGTNEAEAEVANTETAYEAALTEFLAAQAAEATTEAEAEAAIAATLPITITIMGGRRALRPVMPVMTQATGRLTRLMRQQGTTGQQLLRTIPTIQRQTAATLKAIARSGQPINSATVVKAMANATNRVLSNPQRVQRAIVRNAVLRQRTAYPTPRRTVAGRRPNYAPPMARR
jgi:hypothetical protein